ncbi:LLM class F420-dependent oxidoreductase [Candidatus Entotheonella palauensis]|uniref:LLM class F420-dependent oxidoreductase n=1 Tax=Candidatus Entotheonella palauensis TaxID=93172 RepID=UPI000B800B5F|nr:LLM class F420-dependent oxidoreductase [Candidatus Entotheonella palauensis]
MQLGAIFPQTEIGSDPVAVRDFVQAAEDLGYAHLIVFDHVLGVDTSHYTDWQGPYTKDDMFHEPMVLFGYLAAMTQNLELVTAVIILGQRNTALVAKQAAQVDVLSQGRLRLGIGTGWNPVEYEALNENFHDRGKRSEEQIEVMRALWTQDVVNYEGRWHTIRHAGINPLPVQRPIPLWLGGRVEAVVERVGRVADGWFPQFAPDDEGRATLERMHGYARAAGRDPADIGIEGRVSLRGTTPDIRLKEAEAWRDLGASHLSVNTMGAGLRAPVDHISAIETFKETVASVIA